MAWIKPVESSRKVGGWLSNVYENDYIVTKNDGSCYKCFTTYEEAKLYHDYLQQQENQEKLIFEQKRTADETAALRKATEERNRMERERPLRHPFPQRTNQILDPDYQEWLQFKKETDPKFANWKKAKEETALRLDEKRKKKEAMESRLKHLDYLTNNIVRIEDIRTKKEIDEQKRKIDEQERIELEQLRKQQEQLRKQQEQARKQQERRRKQEEQRRKMQEESRKRAEEKNRKEMGCIKGIVLLFAIALILWYTCLD